MQTIVLDPALQKYVCITVAAG